MSGRLRQIGIRMAVEAHGGNVVGLMTRQGLMASLFGIWAPGCWPSSLTGWWRACGTT
jgi:hypothetical protein